ncbi:hypothetical protein A9K55_000680 [Cordyceps militaris]|uniref:Uncharacterized protein n=1 Tax=Cordyceps militaris TaxID=73501 RepID=A0A2H4STW5_CORMI|nr:hypothetical protein A9K55_000680 [Cordyceps militaris]
MAPRRGGSFGSGSGSGGSGRGPSCSSCDSAMSALFLDLYDNGNLYGLLVINALFAAALLVPLALNRRPLAKLALLASFLFFTGCVFQSVRWGLIIPDNWILHGYRVESSVVVLLQRLGWPAVLAALLRAMRPGRLSAAAAWAGVLLLGVLNLAYAALDFVVSDAAIKDWETPPSGWILGDRDWALLWTPGMVRSFTDQPTREHEPGTWSLNTARNRAWLLYLPAESGIFRKRDAQIKLGLAADVIALLVVLALAGVHAVTWRRQGKAELPRRRSFLAIAVGGLLLSALFRIIVSARWILPNWRIITNPELWEDWLSYFPDTNTLSEYVRMPSDWLPGYRTTLGAFPVLQALFEQIGPVVACVLVVLSMAAERRAARAAGQQQRMVAKV